MTHDDSQLPESDRLRLRCEAYEVQNAGLKAELQAERSTCMGTLCTMCKSKPADSHDGCRLRAAEALRESLEMAEGRAIGAAGHEKHWRKHAEDEVARLKASNAALSKELGYAESESFGKSLAPALMKAESERDTARAEVERLSRELTLAISHDRQPYPTASAYENACKHRDQARAEVERLRGILLKAADKLSPAGVGPIDSPWVSIGSDDYENMAKLAKEIKKELTPPLGRCGEGE